jgi:hypothetical protein
MRRVYQPKEKKIVDSRTVFWRRRPSEIKGYKSAFYSTDPESGDYIRVDFNLKEGKIRVYFEDSEEGGNPYYAIITEKAVTSQRNVTTGRQVDDIIDRLNKRSEALLSLPNREIVKILSVALGFNQYHIKKSKRDAERKKMLESTKNRYFTPGKAEDFKSESNFPKFKRNIIPDIMEIVFGLLLCASCFLYFHSYIASGLMSAVFGVLIGLFDMLARGREPGIFKMLLFILSGLGLYIYGYFLF